MTKMTEKCADCGGPEDEHIRFGGYDRPLCKACVGKENIRIAEQVRVDQLAEQETCPDCVGLVILKSGRCDIHGYVSQKYPRETVENEPVEKDLDNWLAEQLKQCAYSKGTEPATTKCSLCNLPLCSSCGYTLDGDKLCNECYEHETVGIREEDGCMFEHSPDHQFQ